MFEEYKTLVLNFYLEMKEKGFLSSDMENPGREKLKHECLLKFSKKNAKKDRDLIQMFFDPKNEYNDDHIRSIEKYDLDKFRPLVGFLTSGKGVRDDKNVKLLAWLLDCPGYEDWRTGVPFPEITPPSPPKPAEDVDTKTEEEEPKEGDNSDPPIIPNSPIAFKHILISCTAFMLIGIGLYQFKENKTSKISSFNTLFSSGNEKCMYWAGDHYQPITCEENLNRFATFPINAHKIANFKRITQPDTLTKNALGKTWYAKREGRIEFYTDSGDHPVDGNKRLLPVTTYILNKYISYHRYLLNLVFWSAGIIICSLIFGIGAIYLGRKVKKQRVKTEK